MNVNKEEKIAQLMKTLELSRDEALELMAEDERVDRMKPSETSNDLTKEQKQVIKKMKNVSRAPTVYNWDTKKRERKPNELKREIIDDLFTFLLENWPELRENANIAYIEQKIDFVLNGVSFTLTVTQHRKK